MQDQLPWGDGKRKAIFHDGFVTPAYRQAGANHENCQSPLAPL
jgi:hypothetical protein